MIIMNIFSNFVSDGVGGLCFLRPLERVWILLAMVYFLFNNDRAKMAGVLLDLVGVLKRIQDYCKD